MTSQIENQNNLPVNNEPKVLPPTNYTILKNQSRDHTFLLVLTFLLFLTGFFGVWYFSNPLPDEKEETEIVNPFANWKTYKNEKNGFSISYPNSWVIQGNDVEAWVIQSTDFSNNIHGIGLPPIGDMRINIVHEPCKDYSNDFVNEKDNLQIDISEKTSCINNFQLTLDLWNKDPNFEQHKKLLNQILLTFKFTK